MVKFLIVAAAMAAVVAPASSAVILTYEAPGVTNTTQAGTFAVETFDSLPAGTAINSTTGLSQTIAGVNFDYSGVTIKPTDQYGGANGSTYAAIYNGVLGGTNNNGAGYTLNVTSGQPINYFGLYVSAADASNTFTFYNGTTNLGTYDLTTLLAEVGVASQGAFFANFNFTGGETYTSVVFSQPVGCCGFESDNHTVGTVASVPEAATWAMMLAGFGMVGSAVRRRRPTAARA